jgi:hypothetical protein
MPPPIPRQLRGDVPCHGCGYNLRGLKSDGSCPECGASIASTLDRAGVPPLSKSDPSWVRKLYYGGIASGLGFLGILPIAAIPGAFLVAVEKPILVVGIAAWLATSLSAWLITSSEPAEDTSRAWHIGSRLAAALHAVFPFTFLFIESAGGTLLVVTRLVCLLASVIATPVCLARVGRLAAREGESMMPVEAKLLAIMSVPVWVLAWGPSVGAGKVAVFIVSPFVVYGPPAAMKSAWEAFITAHVPGPVAVLGTMVTLWSAVLMARFTLLLRRAAHRAASSNIG